MILGALLGAGASEEVIRGSLDALKLGGWTMQIEQVNKGSLAATEVTVHADAGPTSRRYPDIKQLIHASRLSSGVKARALATFAVLAEAEAKVHGAPLEDVHFHEVGGVDAIVDIVGAAAGLESLGAELVVCSPIATGRGITESLHGTIPVPAPAVLEILHGAPLFERGAQELITPTGAAILAAASARFGPMPAMVIDSVGYGAGNRETDVPNVLRVITGTSIDQETGTNLLIETNLDDMSPELVPYAIERLLEAGAVDVWSTAISMKKRRHGILLSILVPERSGRAVLDVLYRETTTLGARVRRVEKEELERHFETAGVEGHPVRVKIGTHNGEVTTVSPEYEDAAKVARLTGLPLTEVYRRAVEVVRK
jgi:uncharacterized protein (TIGR00299 family) protein